MILIVGILPSVLTVHVHVLYIHLKSYIVYTKILEKDNAKQHKLNPKFFTGKLIPWVEFKPMTFSILSRLSALPTELPRQLSWLSSNHPYKYNTKQSKHLNLINR